jgi:hypothetical protein
LPDEIDGQSSAMMMKKIERCTGNLAKVIGQKIKNQVSHWSIWKKWDSNLCRSSSRRLLH